jgi:hypothetical protein
MSQDSIATSEPRASKNETKCGEAQIHTGTRLVILEAMLICKPM